MIEPVSAPGTEPVVPGLHAMLESLPEAYLIVLTNDPVYKVVAVNSSFEKIAKTGKERMLGRGFFEVFPHRRNDILFSLQRVVGTPDVQSLPVANFGLPPTEAGCGENTWRQVYSPLFSGSGEVTHVALRALPPAPTAPERAGVESRNFTYIFDLTGRITYVNRPLLALWGKSLKEALWKNFLELDYPPELAARLQRQIQDVIATGVRVNDETAYTGADGSGGYYEYILVPLLAKDGTVEAVAGSTRNITRRFAAEAERESLMAKLAENNCELVRANKALTRANRKLEEFANISSRDLQEPLRTININTEAQQYAESVNNGVHRMKALLHDVLSYSQAIHSQNTPAETANLSAALRSALGALQPSIADSHASISTGDLPIVAGDEAKGPPSALPPGTPAMNGSLR